MKEEIQYQLDGSNEDAKKAAQWFLDNDDGKEDTVKYRDKSEE